jgi:protein gp37
MSDLFHEQVAEDFIKEVWDIMAETPRHNYQILTKRPDRMADIVGRMSGPTLPNVWLGTSVEDRDVVSRIRELRMAPAAIRFISFPILRVRATGFQPVSFS